MCLRLPARHPGHHGVHRGGCVPQWCVLPCGLPLVWRLLWRTCTPACVTSCAHRGGDVTCPCRADSMGLHKVGNPTDEVAVTLHLYSPPYSSCRIWLDPSNPADVQRPVITFHSMFGELTECVVKGGNGGCELGGTGKGGGGARADGVRGEGAGRFLGRGHVLVDQRTCPSCWCPGTDSKHMSSNEPRMPKRPWVIPRWFLGWAVVRTWAAV
jgi:hypothetical protein